jgi:hypothetical protein
MNSSATSNVDREDLTGDAMRRVSINFTDGLARSVVLLFFAVRRPVGRQLAFGRCPDLTEPVATASLETVLGETTAAALGQDRLDRRLRRNLFERRFRSLAGWRCDAPNGTLVMYSAALSSVVM